MLEEFGTFDGDSIKAERDVKPAKLLILAVGLIFFLLLSGLLLLEAVIFWEPNDYRSFGLKECLRLCYAELPSSATTLV